MSSAGIQLTAEVPSPVSEAIRMCLAEAGFTVHGRGLRGEQVLIEATRGCDDSPYALIRVLQDVTWLWRGEAVVAAVPLAALRYRDTWGECVPLDERLRGLDPAGELSRAWARGSRSAVVPVLGRMLERSWAAPPAACSLADALF